MNLHTWMCGDCGTGIIQSEGYCPNCQSTHLVPIEQQAIDHPAHYTAHPSGVECITITEHMNFCLGNALKYIWRAGLKSQDATEDLKKARWYIDREISRLEGGNS